MKKVKLLWATAFSLFYIVVLSFIQALLIDTKSDFYISLVMPTFLPKPFIFSVVWFIVYLILVITQTEMLAKSPTVSILVSYILLALSNILYLVCFFKLYCPIASLVFAILSLVILFYLLIKFIKSGFKSTFLLFFVILWYSFVVVVNYSIVVYN